MVCFFLFVCEWVEAISEGVVLGQDVIFSLDAFFCVCVFLGIFKRLLFCPHLGGRENVLVKTFSESLNQIVFRYQLAKPFR